MVPCQAPRAARLLVNLELELFNFKVYLPALEIMRSLLRGGNAQRGKKDAQGDQDGR